MKSSTPISLTQIHDNNYIIRILVSLIIGFIIAGALTLFMHVLIESSQQELDKSIRANFLDFVRVQRNETSQRKNVKPQRPQTDDAPPTPPAPQSDQQNMSDTSLQVNIPSVNHIDVDISGIGIGTGDGEYLPLVKIAPSYPFKAMAARIEGSCVVEYTVTQTGATKNIATVKGECMRIFARSSIDAAKKFKYKPRIVDGIAIEVPNVFNRFDFRLEKEEK